MLFKKKANNVQDEPTLDTKEIHPNPNDFILKEKFWDSDLERKVYPLLRSIINEKYTIIPHVSFHDIFKIKKDITSVSDIQSKTAKYHFDFAVFDSHFLPVLLIDVNGRYHTKAYKKEIDAFKRQVVSLCDNLQFLEIDFFDSIKDEDLEEVLHRSLYGHITSRNKYPAYCPSCHSRLNYLYRNDGKGAFYACPHCPNILNPEKNRTFNETDIPPLLKGI